MLLEDINKEFLYDLEINTKNGKIKFNIDFETITKLLDFETNKISIASTKYFNEDYIVLRLLYKGKTIGDGRYTNVIADF